MESFLILIYVNNVEQKIIFIIHLNYSLIIVPHHLKTVIEVVPIAVL